jgi:hypothetical protein
LQKHHAQKPLPTTTKLFSFSFINMKLTFATLSFASVASAASLRSQANGSHSFLTTNVALKGVNGKASEKDMEFIGKALVASYNNVHWEAGHFLAGHETIDVFPICRQVFLLPQTILTSLQHVFLTQTLLLLYTS